MKYVLVTDFLPNEVTGGAELTFEAIRNAAPEGLEIFYIKSENITKAHWHEKGVHWILGNYTRINKEVLEELCILAQKREIIYSVVEFDYKYCIIRNEKVHNNEFYRTGRYGFCNCQNDLVGTYTKTIFGFAQKVHFMSQGQMDLILKKMPILQANKENMRIQWSTWQQKDIEFINSLYESSKEKNNKWAIQESQNWLKGSETAKEHAIKNGYDFALLPNMPYEDFLKELSKYKGFIFHPNAWDTCPRVVIEAILLGLEIDINDNVQIKQEIAGKTREEILASIKTNAASFWDSYQL